MSGIHDLGGIYGMGPIEHEKNEPVYHAEWEGRVDAIAAALQATGKIPGTRRTIEEKIPGAEYLRMSYYEKWYTALVELLIAAKFATRSEIESGQSAERSTNSIRPVPATEAVAFRTRNQSSTRQNVALAPLFQVGQRVRARNKNPVTYTRLPRYARGRLGTVATIRGVFTIPDVGAGGKAQTLYSVRFAARDLWGEEAAPQDAVYIDMWDGYLESA
jgi:nitrile hydratase subunit beta